MLTIIAYCILRYNFDSDWTGWLLVIPVLLDLTIIDKISKGGLI